MLAGFLVIVVWGGGSGAGGGDEGGGEVAGAELLGDPEAVSTADGDVADRARLDAAADGVAVAEADDDAVSLGDAELDGVVESAACASGDSAVALSTKPGSRRRRARNRKENPQDQADTAYGTAPRNTERLSKPQES